MTTKDILSPEQARSLFDLLSHHEVYKELQDFRYPDLLSRCGHPFQSSTDDTENHPCPLLYALFTKFVLTLPGIRDVSLDFWQTRCQGLVDDLAKANLSESYEKGNIGIRKTLATAAAALVEAPSRGCFGGLSRSVGKDEDSDIIVAWNEFLQELVYGDLIDEMFSQAAKTDKIEDHSMLVQRAHEYILIILASFIHYIFVISPEGQTILSMIKRANDMVPYFAIRQTLRIGNVASMIKGLMNIVLAKMSINTVTTFLGMTEASDQGMNLLQTIISTVLGWDINELKKKASKIEKGTNAPSKEQLETIKTYVDKSREEHEKCRIESEVKAEPIAAIVLQDFDSPAASEEQLSKLLEFLSLRLSIRDRKEIITALCKRQPDLLTQAIKDAVAAYDPVIRAVHNAVDLSETLSDFENFLNDLLKVSRPSSGKPDLPSVLDYVQLLRKHQGSSHKFLHQVAKNGPELSQWYRDYVKEAAAQFEKGDSAPSGAAGSLTPGLSRLVSSLPESERATVLRELDSYSAHLRNLASTSTTRMRDDVAAAKDQKTSSTPQKPTTIGPGMFLAKWQSYINATSITPLTNEGGVRSGSDASVRASSRLQPDGSKDGLNLVTASKEHDSEPPKCETTVRLLLPKFRGILQEQLNIR